MTLLYKPLRTLFAGLTLGLLMTASCKKALEIDPPSTQIVSSQAFVNDMSATSVMTGMYSNMMSAATGFVSGNRSITTRESLAADELVNYLPASQDASMQEFYTNTYNIASPYFWNEFYQRIYTCNATIEGVTASTGISDAVRAQLLGEAKFFRAFIYFYAVNTYGDVPLALTTDYRINNTLSRTPKARVYEQIVADLKDAEALMGNDYFKGTTAGSTERARPNKAAASALLARAYLYMEQWANAEAAATSVINNGTYSLETDLNRVFISTSKEAIWYLQTVIPTNYSTYDGQYFMLTRVAPGTSAQSPVAIRHSFFDSFEQGDARRTNWIDTFTINNTDYYFPFKYQKNMSTTPEALLVLRLAEQYLIRAEARAKLGNVTGANSAASDINVIRKRAGLQDTQAANQPDMLKVVAAERRSELFTEWGHRWFDLIRTDKVDSIMSVLTPLKGGVWNSNYKILPIPYSETQINTNLKQNPGYN